MFEVVSDVLIFLCLMSLIGVIEVGWRIQKKRAPQ
jgi:hypothetical protein